MRNRLLAVVAVIVAAMLLSMTPVVAQAAKLITGKNIKDSSVTGKDIKDSSLSGDDLKDASVGGADVRSSSLDGSDLADGSLTGSDIGDGTVTGTDVDESTFGTVPKAVQLAILGSGETQSGAFSAASAATTGDAGYLGFAINYLRPLATPIANDHIVDTVTDPDLATCPGPGQAAAGYLCLYFNNHEGTADVYGYSDGAPYNQLPQSVGVGLYAQVTSTADLYIDGVWTVTAP